MRSPGKLLTLMLLFVVVSSVCHGATITGTVKGSGTDLLFKGAFVQAQNTKTKMTFMGVVRFPTGTSRWKMCRLERTSL
jgi:hypothetical protein